MPRRNVVGIGLMVGLMFGCSEPPYQLPDRSTPEVQAEEQRLAALLPDRLLWGPGTCEVRLLGSEGSSSFAWASCEMTPTANGQPGGVSLPVRVDGTRVTEPADGAGYADSVKRMFPQRLADAVLDEPERLQP
ncbi:hypothetical protein [Micromonospora deserti]|uniref:hypothetical protein n=1 Tax=Micromonospora deserti TaxID=2070366 RepID=UPI0011B696E7|nr:hypothetical protein [Micromonospora deserti]